MGCFKFTSSHTSRTDEYICPHRFILTKGFLTSPGQCNGKQWADRMSGPYSWYMFREYGPDTRPLHTQSRIDNDLVKSKVLRFENRRVRDKVINPSVIHFIVRKYKQYVDSSRTNSQQLRQFSNQISNIICKYYFKEFIVDRVQWIRLYKRPWLQSGIDYDDIFQNK